MSVADTVLAKARQVIAEHGVIVAGVGGGDGTMPFAYTAGLTARNHPELMITGNIGYGNAAAILNSLARRVLDDGEQLAAGDSPPVLGDGYGVVLAGPLTAAQLGEYRARIANELYGRPRVRVLQVVYQDAGRRFPWDDGYEMAGQPLLAPAPPRRPG